MEPISFLDGISGYVRKSTNGAADKGIRLAVIDPAYDPFDPPYPNSIALPKVTFEGETTLSGKTYAVASGYIPYAGARVWMVPIGNSWLIAGAVTGYGAQGFYSAPDGSPQGVEFGDGSYFDVDSGLTLTGDADIAGDLYVGGIGAVRYKRKTSGTTRTNSTVTADPDLANLFLEVGTWDIEYILKITGTTGDFQGSWTFSGTWSGTKDIIGPSSSTELQDHGNTLARFSSHQLGTSVAYGLNSTSVFTGVRERSMVTVTVAGNAGYQWAQQTTDATASGLQGGSFIRAERVA